MFSQCFFLPSRTLCAWFGLLRTNKFRPRWSSFGSCIFPFPISVSSSFESACTRVGVGGACVEFPALWVADWVTRMTEEPACLWWVTHASSRIKFPSLVPTLALLCLQIVIQWLLFTSEGCAATCHDAPLSTGSADKMLCFCALISLELRAAIASLCIWRFDREIATLLQFNSPLFKGCFSTIVFSLQVSLAPH